MLSRTVIIYWLVLGGFRGKGTQLFVEKSDGNMKYVWHATPLEAENKKHFIKERAKWIVSSVLSLRLYFYA